MTWPLISDRAVALAAMVLASSLSACFSSTQWNADQVAEIRRRAAFDLSCPADDLEIVEIDRDAHGLVQRLGAVGCGRKVTFVNARSGFAAAKWTLAVGRTGPGRAIHRTTDTAHR
jgi:hypothetical protein